MKIFKIILLSALVTTPAFANSLSCAVQINNGQSIHSSPQTKWNERTPLAITENVKAFVTQKSDDIFLLEAFVPGVDARIYSEGSLKEATDSLKASLWGRDLLLEMSCQLSQ